MRSFFLQHLCSKARNFFRKIYCFISSVILVVFIISVVIYAVSFDPDRTGILYTFIYFCNKHYDKIVDLCTSLGALFTVGVFITTYKATKNAEKSTKLSMISLNSVQENNKKDNFLKQFYLLLDLHNNTHKLIIENIEKYKELISWEDSFVNKKSKKTTLVYWDENIKNASNNLFKNYEFTPYMITLYRLLKHIDNYFYNNNGNNRKEKKIYSSIVRGIIRNDVLYLIALNSLHSDPVFFGYRRKLKKFNFFEHLTVDNISESIRFSPDECIEKFQIKNSIIYNLKSEIKKYHLFNEINYNTTKLNIKEIFPLSIIYYYRLNKDFGILLLLIKKTISNINKEITKINEKYIAENIINDMLKYPHQSISNIYRYKIGMNEEIIKIDCITGNDICNHLEEKNSSKSSLKLFLNEDSSETPQENIILSPNEYPVGHKKNEIIEESIDGIYNLSIYKCRERFIKNIELESLKIKIARNLLHELKNNNFIKKSLNCENFELKGNEIIILSEEPHCILHKPKHKPPKTA